MPEFARLYDRGDGICKHLMENNRCEIYDHRPEVCNVDLMYEKYYSSLLSREDFYALNAKSCQRLKETDQESI